MNGGESVMKEGTKRSIFRRIHIIVGIPIIGYIYDSPTDTPNYAWSIRCVLLPVLLISGLWTWKGHVVRRLISKRAAGGTNLVSSLLSFFGAFSRVCARVARRRRVCVMS